jgi:hypothetical protein
MTLQIIPQQDLQVTLEEAPDLMMQLSSCF